jgi:hypothetical protein
MASAKKKTARSAPAKSKASKKAVKAAPPKSKAPVKAAKAPAKAAKKAARPVAKKAGKPTLASKVAKALGVSEAQAVAMAIGELGARLNVGGEATAKAKAAAPAKAAPDTGSMGQRLFLALDNRGLDGMGMPVEVIDLPCVLGSGKSCTIWINSPQIETRHAQITRGDEGWILEDLGSTHGTFFEGSPLGRRVLQHGDLFLLANYLRVRAELR